MVLIISERSKKKFVPEKIESSGEPFFVLIKIERQFVKQVKLSSSSKIFFFCCLHALLCFDFYYSEYLKMISFAWVDIRI